VEVEVEVWGCKKLFFTEKSANLDIALWQKMALKTALRALQTSLLKKEIMPKSTIVRKKSTINILVNRR
jgi:hypothetical protein